MKKFICFISLFVVELLFAEVTSNRIVDEGVHFKMPSWVEMSDANEIDLTTQVGNSSTFKTELSLPTTHSISYWGESYSVLTLYNTGKIEFGTRNPDYETAPVTIYPTTASQTIKFSRDKVKWKCFSTKSSNYVAIEYGPFINSGKSYSVQTLIYTTGEIQTQIWNHSSKQLTWEEWMVPIIDDGRYYSRRLPQTYLASNTIDLYGQNGLREGWIAKDLLGTNTSTSYVDITEPQKGAGLRVEMFGKNNDLGGIIAYDYSEEHPVVGGISSVEISTSGLASNGLFNNLYCWYFNEYYKTYVANYPYLSSSNTSLTLSRNDYDYTWYAYKTNPNLLQYEPNSDPKQSFVLRTDETLDFVAAPAFKFQRTRYNNADVPDPFVFYITSVKYNLAQLQSVQFYPPTSKSKLIIVNSEGGRVSVPNLEGTADKNDPNTKTYELFVGKIVSGEIVASPGYEIDKIWYFETVANTGNLYVDDALQPIAGATGFTKISNEKILFKISPSNFFKFKVTYKKCTTRSLAYVTPNIVETEIYSDPNKSPDVSATISNAFGSVIQRQSKISKGSYAVETFYANGINQKTLVPMVFVHKNTTDKFEYVDLACKNCITEANGYFNDPNGIDNPDAKGNAFSETQYFNSNSNGDGAISASAGIAEQSFALGDGKYAKDWVMPACNEEDFIPHEFLNENGIKNAYSNRSSGTCDFVLKIHRSAKDKYTQEIYNSKGQLKSGWLYNGNEAMISLYEYDEFGNLLKSYNKSFANIPTENTYDAQNRLISTNNKDRGLSETRYDSMGRLRFVRSAAQKAKGNNYFTVSFYDDIGRTVGVGEIRGESGVDFDNPDDVNLESKAHFISKTIYGKPNESVLTNLGIDVSLVRDILNQMKGIRPNDVGVVISFDDEGNFVTVKLSDYNRIGKLVRYWEIFGENGVPALQLSYEYDITGAVTNSSFCQWNGSSWGNDISRSRTYDEKGRLETISENGLMLAKYDYTANGNVKQKTYYDKGTVVLKKNIARDVYGRPTEISYIDKNGKQIYTTTLNYESAFDAQIKEASHEYNTKGNVSFSRKNEYTYDYMNQLTNVTGDLDGEYSYDGFGRITKKGEDNSLIDYAYTQTSYRPSGFNINGGSPSVSEEYFRYDASGNAWYDKHANALYKNNVMGLPTKVSVFDILPTSVTLSQVNSSAGVSGTKSNINITYDETGARVSYSVKNVGADIDYTEVSVPGVGVFRSTSESTAFTLDRQDLVAGGFRKGNFAYFPVTDAQGNVRGYATTEGLISAMDYYPYGTVVDLTVDNTDSRNRWQSKEFDGEYGKYYFGSRLFDPFFALWMSPDPAAQFANPYTYGGDPVNYVDPNGESITLATIVTAAVVGAVIGGSTAAYQCSKYGSGNCSTAISTSSIVGAAAGAAGGAAGGAAAGAAAGAGEAAIVGGMAGGAAGNATGYVVNGLLTGQDMSLGEGFHTAMMGAFSGAISGGVGYGWSQIPYLSYWEMGGRAVSSSVSSMAETLFTEEDFSHIGQAALEGLIYGASSAEANTLVSLGLIYGINAFGGVSALNKFYGTEHGEFMTEAQAATEMTNTPGSVSASVANDLLSLAIAVISGNGPFSHVRASDDYGKIVENNRYGVMEYYDPTYEKHPNRLTYVTKDYVGGQKNGATVASLKKMYGQNGWSSYKGAGLCVGASGMVNPYYTPRSPNGLYPWGLRNTYLYY